MNDPVLNRALDRIIINAMFGKAGVKMDKDSKSLFEVVARTDMVTNKTTYELRQQIPVFDDCFGQRVVELEKAIQIRDELDKAITIIKTAEEFQAKILDEAKLRYDSMA